MRTPLACLLGIGLYAMACSRQQQDPTCTACESGRRPEPAIVLAAFGSSNAEARTVYDDILAAARERFPDHDVRLAYTSGFILRRLRAKGIDGQTPAEALADLREEGVARAVVQSLHVMPGKEFEDLAALVNEEHPHAVDSETAGMLASLGIAHGQPFNPDERMNRILGEAAKIGSAMALATSYRTRLPLQRYDDRQWIEIGNTGYPYYEQDGHTMLSGLTSMLEPLLMVFLGVVIGGLVICMFLPIFKMSEVVAR